MKQKYTNKLSLRKVILSAMVAAPLATLPTPMWALPSTASSNVTSSSSSTTFTTVGTTLNISTPDRTVLKWVAFGDGGANAIANGDAIIYNLPSTSSSVLNMVTGGSATTVSGTLSSNGKILILNQNGITVDATGKITAAGVSLSTRPETEFYYTANGDLGYNGTPTTDISVAGSISVGSSGNVLLSARNVAVTGNIDAGLLTINAGVAGAGGAVTLGGGTDVTVGNATGKYGTLVVNTNGGNLDATNGTANVIVSGGNATFNTGNGTITQGSTGALKIGKSDSDATLNITAGTGAVTLAKVNDNSTGGKTLTVNVASAGTTNITSDADKLAVAATTTGDLTAKAAKDLTLKASNIGGALSLTSTGGNINSGGNTTVKSGSTITLSAVNNGSSITYAGVGNLTFGTITAAADGLGSVTLSSTGDVPVPTITNNAKSLTVTSGGNITQTGALTATTATFDAGGKTTVDTTTNNFGTVVLKNAPNSATIVDADGFTLGTGTNATGNVSVTANGAGAIAIGALSGDTLVFGQNLTITTANSNVTQASDNTTVAGKLTIAAGTGSVTLAGSTGKAIGLNNQYGQVNITAAAATVFEQTSLDLGTINLTGDLVAYSANSILNSGKLTVPGTTIVGAGTAAAPGAISLNYVKNGASNALATVTLLDDINLLNGTATAPVAPLGNMLASSVTIENSGSLSFSIAKNIYGTPSTAAVNLTTLGAGNNITTTVLNTTGPVSLTSDTGSITTTASADNAFSTVNVTSGGGAVSISTPKDLTVNATLNGNDVDAHPNAAATFTSTGGNVTIGTVTSVYDLAGIGFTAATGKTVSDSVAGISIYGPVSFTADTGNITITKAGHSFGGITASIAHGDNSATGAISIVEGGTLKVLGASAEKGSVSLQSSNQSIVDPKFVSNTASVGVINSGTATFTANQGAVQLLAVTNAVGGNVSITGMNDSALTTSGGLKLNSVTVAAGNLTINAGGDISEINAANIYGDTMVTTSGKITMTNTGNRFGGLILSSTGNKDIAVTEDTTLNIKSVQTSGKLTLESVHGDIVDSIDSNVAANKISKSDGTAIGAATFTSDNGSVTLDNAGNNFSTVSFTTAKDATIIQPTGGDITLGASTIGGALTVTNQVSGADILQSGAIAATGNATFNTNAGAVSLGNTANSFGPVRFVVGQASTLTENSTFNLNSGSVATAPVVINTNGNFITSGTGGSSFTSDLTINAIGTIVPSAGSLLVTGTFTVFSNNTKDLSALSQSGNLAGKAPVNQGTGTYVPPSP